MLSLDKESDNELEKILPNNKECEPLTHKYKKVLKIVE